MGFQSRQNYQSVKKNNMTSEEIILNTYKSGHLTLEEAVQLIKDIKPTFYPYYPQIYPNYPWIIYSDEFKYNPDDWRVTSTTTTND